MLQNGLCLHEDLANNIATAAAAVVEFELVIDANGDSLIPSETVDIDSSVEVQKVPAAALDPGGEANEDECPCLLHRAGSMLNTHACSL